MLSSSVICGWLGAGGRGAVAAMSSFGITLRRNGNVRRSTTRPHTPTPTHPSHPTLPASGAEGRPRSGKTQVRLVGHARHYLIPSIKGRAALEITSLFGGGGRGGGKGGRGRLCGVVDSRMRGNGRGGVGGVKWEACGFLQKGSPGLGIKDYYWRRKRAKCPKFSPKYVVGTHKKTGADQHGRVVCRGLGASCACRWPAPHAA